MWPGLGDGATDPVPGLARGRCRGHPADRDDHHRRHLSSDRTRPDPGLHLGRVRRGGNHRPDARRLSGAARDLVAGVLDQPADRGGDLCHVRSVPARAANPAPPPHRLSRLGLDDAGRRRADAGAGGGREFGRDADGRGARCGRPRCAGGAGSARTGGSRADPAAAAMARAGHRHRQLQRVHRRRGDDVDQRLSAALRAGGDGPQPDRGRDGARRRVGQLDLCQPRRRAVDDPHLVSAGRGDRRRLSDRRRLGARHPRSREQPAMGRYPDRC